MDSLYSGLKALEGQTNGKQGNRKYLDSEELRVPIVGVEKDMFVLVDDVLPLLERAAIEPLPPKDEKGPQNRTKFERSFQFLNFAMEGATKWDPVGWKASDELKQIFGQPKHINQQESAAPVISALEADLEQARARINELIEYIFLAAILVWAFVISQEL